MFLLLLFQLSRDVYARVVEILPLRRNHALIYCVVGHAYKLFYDNLLQRANSVLRALGGRVGHDGSGGRRSPSDFLVRYDGVRRRVLNKPYSEWINVLERNSPPCADGGW